MKRRDEKNPINIEYFVTFWKSSFAFSFSNPTIAGKKLVDIANNGRDTTE